MMPDGLDFGGSFPSKCLCVGFGRDDVATEHQRAGAQLWPHVSPLPASRNPLPCWELHFNEPGLVAGDVCRRAGG